MSKIPLSFEKISSKLFSYVCDLYLPGERFPYSLQKGGYGTLLGSAFAAYIASMLCREQELPGKKQIADEILCLRDPDTGLFVDPALKSPHFLNPSSHSALYTTLQSTCFCLAALHALGVDFDRRIKWLSPLLEQGKIEKWLDELDWNNPWLVSNLDMFLGIFLLEWQAHDPNEPRISNALEEYFRWHDAKQIETTGYWGSQKDVLNAMAGAYHIVLHYDYAEKTMQYVDRMIDSTLGLIWKDGLFVYGGGGGSCEDMDAIDILVRLSLISDYRREDVEKTLTKSAYALSLGQAADGGYSWKLQPKPVNFIRLLCSKMADCSLAFGTLYAFMYKLRHRSYFNSTHYYSSLSIYPFKSDCSDMWSSWFRPLALAMIARRYPHRFYGACDWKMPCWPGLGYDPFL